jgi:hypothetical protein
MLLPLPLIIVIGGYLRLKKRAAEAIAKDDAAAPPLQRLPLGIGFVLR